MSSGEFMISVVEMFCRNMVLDWLKYLMQTSNMISVNV